MLLNIPLRSLIVSMNKEIGPNLIDDPVVADGRGEEGHQELRISQILFYYFYIFFIII